MSEEIIQLVDLALSVFQAAIVFGAAIIAFANLRKFRDARATDFIIEAESKIDPLRHSLVDSSPALIRSIYGSYDIEELSDEECGAFPFMQSVYSHVSRMYYILTNERLDLGLRPDERAEVIDSWTRYLATFSEHPAMRRIHESAMRRRDFNESFLQRAEQVMDGGGESGGSSAASRQAY